MARSKKASTKSAALKSAVVKKAAAKAGASKAAALATSRASSWANTVKASDFKAKCLDLMDEVQQRQIEVVVTKRGTPVAKLAPVEAAAPNPLGFLRGTVVSDIGLVETEDDTWGEPDSDPLSPD